MSSELLLYENDVFEEGGSESGEEDSIILTHPKFIMMEAELKEMKSELEYHKNLCKQLQKVAISHAQRELDDKFIVGAADRSDDVEGSGEVIEEKPVEEVGEGSNAKKSGGKKTGSKKTKVDLYVDEMMAAPRHSVVMDEIMEKIDLPWDKKKPSRGFMREYLRMKFHNVL